MNGYRYFVTPEQIARHQRLPLRAKLQLLEEFIIFNDRFTSDRAKEIQRKLRKGESGAEKKPDELPPAPSLTKRGSGEKQR